MATDQGLPGQISEEPSDPYASEEPLAPEPPPGAPSAPPRPARLPPVQAGAAFLPAPAISLSACDGVPLPPDAPSPLHPPRRSAGLRGASFEAKTSAFHHLVERLVAEHDQEVSGLREMIARLTTGAIAQLSESGAENQDALRQAARPEARRPWAEALVTENGDHDPFEAISNPQLPAPASANGNAGRKAAPPPISESSKGPVGHGQTMVMLSELGQLSPTQSADMDADVPREAFFDTAAISIFVEGATGLRRADWGPGCSSDPYCVVSVPERPSMENKTPVIENSLAPIWNHKVVFTDYDPEESLLFKVWDHDWADADDCLGWAKLQMSEIGPSGVFQGTLPLQEAGSGGEKASVNVKVTILNFSQYMNSGQVELDPLWLHAPKSKEKEAESSEAISPSQGGNESFLTKLSKITGRTHEMQEALESMHSMPLKRRGMVMCFLTGFLLSPESMRRLWWDIIGIFVLMLDLVWIPLQVFNPPEVAVISWTTLLYWSCDMGLTFNSGFYSKQGDLVMNRIRIAKNYFKGWLIFDLFLVGVDWGITIQSWVSSDGQGSDIESAGAARAARLARATRIIRLLRLMRVAKMRTLLESLQNMLDSEWLMLVFAVSKNVLTLLAVNHILACLWYSVATSVEDDNWVASNQLQNEDWYTLYLMAMNWSMAQFTPGASNLQPRCTVERIFSIWVLSLGLIMATCFVSSITSTMASMWTMKRYNSMQTVLLKRYLNQNTVSPPLKSRITRYVAFVNELRQKRVPPSKVHFLQLISAPLHIELQTELFQPRLSAFPFFTQYAEVSSEAMSEICATAVTTTNYAKNDAVFARHMEAKEMSFLAFGSLMYNFGPLIRANAHTAVDPNLGVAFLSKGHWYSEACMWLPWKYRGEMKAMTEADTVSVTAKKFRDVTARSPAVYVLARAHAYAFWRELEEDPLMVFDIPPSEIVAAHHPKGRQSLATIIQEEETEKPILWSVNNSTAEVVKARKPGSTMSSASEWASSLIKTVSSPAVLGKRESWLSRSPLRQAAVRRSSTTSPEQERSARPETDLGEPAAAAVRPP